MLENTSQLSRRDALGCLVPLGALALIGMGIRGCISGLRADTEAHYAHAGDELMRIVEQDYPNFSKTGSLPGPTGDLASIASGSEKALRSYGLLLGVKNELASGAPPILNSIQQLSRSPDCMMGDQALMNLSGFQHADQACTQIRSAFSSYLAQSKNSLQSIMASGEFSGDPVTLQLLGSIIPRLDILATRIEQQRLMTGNNILRTTSKFGEFAEILGQTEHYEEALAELSALGAHLAAK